MERSKKSMGLKKKPTLKHLRKKLWSKYFSPYIRQKENGVCITCGIKKEWKEQQAGHFIHRDCLDFDERNVHCQCVSCNKWRSGNLVEYAVKLERMYGQGIIQKLKKEADKNKVLKYSEIEEKIAYYKDKLKSL